MRRKDAVDVAKPLPRRLDMPIIDMHCHGKDIEHTTFMVDAAKAFGISKMVCICRAHEMDALEKAFGDMMVFNIWLDYANKDNPAQFAEDNRRLLHEAAGRGVRCIKFWYKPQFNDQYGYFFDDWRLDPVFETMIELGLAGLVHIADPDTWWKTHYSDAEKFETKKFTYRQLTNTLGRYPSLKILAAHMGGHPENLDHLSELLERYPNFHIDTSGTKWVARELSRQPGQTREFFLRWPDRIMFGSDLVAFAHADYRHHCSRYWVHQFLYEQSGTVESPIEDPDAGGPVTLVGLDLPDEFLRKLYVENAVAFFRIDP